MMNVGLRLPPYLLSQYLYVVLCDECRTEIAYVLALTVFICVLL